jgi:hypothetical protein
MEQEQIPSKKRKKEEEEEEIKYPSIFPEPTTPKELSKQERFEKAKEEFSEIFGVELPIKAFEVLERSPRQAKRYVPALQRCPNPEEVENVPNKYLFKIIDDSNKVIDCKDIRYLMHIEKIRGSDILNNLIGEKNAARARASWNFVSPFRGVESTIPEQQPVILNPVLYNPQQEINWENYGGLNYLEYSKGNLDYITNLIGLGAQVALLPENLYKKWFVESLQKISLTGEVEIPELIILTYERLQQQKIVGELIEKTQEQTMYKTEDGEYKIIPNEDILYEQQVENDPSKLIVRYYVTSPRARIIAQYIGEPSEDKTLFRDLSGNELLLQQREIIDILKMQQYLSLEITSNDIETPYTTYVFVPSIDEKFPKPGTIELPYPIRYQIWGDPSTPPEEPKVVVQPKILPLAAKFQLQYTTKESVDNALKYIGKEANIINYLVQILESLRMVIENQNIIIKTIDNDPKNAIVLKVREIYGYVKQPGSYIYEINRISVANTSGGELGLFLVDFEPPPEDAKKTNSLYLQTLFEQPPEKFGWAITTTKEKQEIQKLTGEMEKIGLEPTITGIFQTQLTKKQIQELTKQPLSKKERAHYVSTLRKLANEREKRPERTPEECIPGLHIRDPSFVGEIIFRYLFPQKKWYQIGIKKLPLRPLDDRELVSLIETSQATFYGLDKDCSFVQFVIPKVTEVPPQKKRKLMFSPKIESKESIQQRIQKNVEYIIQQTNIPQQISQQYNIPVNEVNEILTNNWYNFSTGNWKPLEEQNLLELLQKVLMMLYGINIRDIQDITQTSLDPKYKVSGINDKKIMETLSKYYYEIIVLGEQPKGLTRNESFIFAFLLKKYPKLKSKR